MNNSLKYLQSNLVWVMPIVMGLGAITGLITDISRLTVLLIPLSFLMVLPVVTVMDYSLLSKWDDPKVQIFTLFTNFLIIPTIAYGLGIIFFPEQLPFQMGLFLAALLPTSGMTIAWTSMTGGKVSSAVKMSIVGLVLGSLLSPFYMKFVFGGQIDFPLNKLLSSIFLVVFLPLAMGYLIQKTLISKMGKPVFAQKIKPNLPPWSTLAVLMVVFLAMGLRIEVLLTQPMMALKILVPVILLYAFNFIGGTWLARQLLPREEAIAYIYGTALRNLSIALAVAMVAFGGLGLDIALVIAVAFVVQTQGAVWHAKVISNWPKQQ